MSKFGTVDVCLAQTSSQAEALRATIRSILDQSYEDLRVNLYLLRDPPSVDDEPLNFSSDFFELQVQAGERLRIQYTKDIGPYSSLLPYLQENWGRSRLVVTADDEIIYPKDWLLGLLEAHASVGCSVATRGRRMIIEGQRFAPYRSWAPRNIDDMPSILTVPSAKDGVLYDTAFFPRSVLNVADAMRLAPTAADLWLQWHLAMNGVATYVIDTECLSSPDVAREEKSLYLNWDRFETNDTAVDALDAYFNDVYSFDLNALADEETQSAQAVPNYRVHDRTPELGMIFDPCFRDLMVTSKLPGQIQLSKNWVVALQAKEAGTHGQVRAEPLKGLKISWEGTPKLVQLWQDLEFGDSDPDIAVDIEVTLTIQTVADHPKLIDYVVIEKQTGSGWVQEKLRLKVLRQGEDGITTVVGRVTEFQFDQTQSRLRIQFNKSPKSMILRSVRGSVRQRDGELIVRAVSRPVEADRCSASGVPSATTDF